MEHKFITLHKGALRDCYVDFDGRVIIHQIITDGEKVIGTTRANGILPQQVVYPSTGKPAKNGTIYLGHIIESPVFGYKATVIWDSLKAGFYLDFGDTFGKDRYQQFDDYNLRSENCRIITHVELEGK